MLKVALDNEERFNRLSQHPMLRWFIVFRTDCIPNLRSPALVSTIYSRIYTSDGTNKHTAPGRFSDLDLLVANYLNHESNSIHDVAVSSGVTSVELYSTLRDRGIPFKLFVSDKFSRYFCRGTLVRRIYAYDGKLVCAYIGWVLADGKCSWKFPISRALFSLVEWLDVGGAPSSEISLYDSRLTELIRRRDVEEMPYDVFSTSMHERFTLVRCMNVLNPENFTPDAICRALSLLKASLKEGGILLLGRTLPDGTHAASIYRKVSGYLEVVRAVGRGCEFGELVAKRSQDDRPTVPRR